VRPPASFGRQAPAEDEEIRIEGGQAFHMALHLDVTPSKESLAQLFDAVRETTRQAVIAGRVRGDGHAGG
jgi:hypothetical protein